MGLEAGEKVWTLQLRGARDCSDVLGSCAKRLCCGSVRSPREHSLWSSYRAPARGGPCGLGVERAHSPRSQSLQPRRGCADQKTQTWHLYFVSWGETSCRNIKRGSESLECGQSSRRGGCGATQIPGGRMFQTKRGCLTRVCCLGLGVSSSPGGEGLRSLQDHRS